MTLCKNLKNPVETCTLNILDSNKLVALQKKITQVINRVDGKGKSKKQWKTHSINNSSKIPSKSVFVNVFAKKVILCSYHDFGGCATRNDIKRVPKVNLQIRLHKSPLSSLRFQS